MNYKVYLWKKQGGNSDELKADYAIEYRWTTVHVLFKLSLVYLQISYYNIIINHIHYATCCVGIEKEIYNA